MKKRGFTLVELLAVIAILALLVIIALPNIVAMFNEAKKNSFLTECKQIFKSAQNQWMTDSMINTDEQVYVRCKTCTGKALQLNGRQEIEYIINLNKAGKVVFFEATDGTYQYSYSGNDLKIEDISTAHEIAKLSEEDKIIITAPINGDIYIAYDGQLKIGQAVPDDITYYKSYSELRAASSRPAFLKHKVVNNIVRESYIGVEVNGNLDYFRGGPGKESYEQDIAHIKRFFNEVGCFSTMNDDSYGCKDSGVEVLTDINGNIRGTTASGCGVGCYIESDGTSRCDSLNAVC